MIANKNLTDTIQRLKLVSAINTRLDVSCSDPIEAVTCVLASSGKVIFFINPIKGENLITPKSFHREESWTESRPLEQVPTFDKKAGDFEGLDDKLW